MAIGSYGQSTYLFIGTIGEVLAQLIEEEGEVVVRHLGCSTPQTIG